MIDSPKSEIDGKADIRSPYFQESSSDEEFKDAAQETTKDTPSSPPPPRARSLTHMSHSTVSSVPEVPQSPAASVSVNENRNSQASVTPPTTTNGSVKENGSSEVIKSPTRRISTTSLDEVSLIDELPPAKVEAIVETPSVELPVEEKETPPSPPAPVPEQRPAPTSTPSFVESIASKFGRNTSNNQSQAAAPAQPKRKLSSPFLPSPAVSQPQSGPAPAVKRSPFSWLRSGTSSSSAQPAPMARRGTVSSSISSLAGLAGLGSSAPAANNELLINRVAINRDPEKEKEDLQRGMDNLRENFKKLREAKGHTADEPSAEATARKGSISLGSTIRTKLRFYPTGPEDTTPAAPGSPGSSRSVAATSTKTDDEIDWDLWQAVVDDALKVASEKPTELNRAIQAGIPPTLRGTIWQSLAASKSLEMEALYREVIVLPSTATAEDARAIFGSYWLWDPSPAPSQASSPRIGSRASPAPELKVSNVAMKWGMTVAQLEKVIKRDLGDRTSFGKYKVDQKALLNVCKAYALFDPAVGYTQGMTFIATVLLLNMSEEESFCVFVKLMNKYKLRSMFMEKMKGLELRLYQYDRFLEDHEPRLAIHLKRQHIESSLYAAQWFLTLFTYKFPLQLVLRVFDLLFSEGLEGPILQFGIVLMKQNAEKLLTMEFDTLGPFLKEKLFDVYIDPSPSSSSIMEAGFFGNGGEKDIYRANDLISDAMSIKISQEMLDRYEQDWEEHERTKRDTEQELESLKRNNASLQSKVKKLEEQNEELNREYVRIASSEVGLKVQNDQLLDENESLKTKVDTLRDMVDKQPQEVEDRLKGEMEQLIQKNLAVHHANQTLEESMMEMEKELVSTKMQLATVNEDYDLLKNRWHDLRKALGD
ncbi:putative GTPase activating protein [Pyronema omphalodes]|nr:putative GTPase activating protein [Pyronema omphalodes]